MRVNRLSLAHESPFIGKVKAIHFFSDFPLSFPQCFPVTDAMDCMRVLIDYIQSPATTMYVVAGDKNCTIFVGGGGFGITLYMQH